MPPKVNQFGYSTSTKKLTCGIKQVHDVTPHEFDKKWVTTPRTKVRGFSTLKWLN